MDEEGIAELFMDDNVLADVASMVDTSLPYLTPNILTGSRFLTT